MRSGTGRHRRPRQAPAIFVTAGVTGAGFAMPLLAAVGAQAADTATWDRVAECESEGVWSANEDNGFYGGLQLTMSTWEEYGGTAYAERPDLASRSQQIAIAEKILAAEGPQGWPRCAVYSGLSEDSTEKPDIDPGDMSVSNPTPSPTPSPVSPDRDESASDQAGQTDQSQGSPEGDEPALEGSGKSSGTGTGKHRGEPEEGQQSERDGQRPDRSADRAGQGGEGYLVQPGDSLSRIAWQQDVSGGWPEIYAANESVIGDDADLILPGQRLDLGK